MKNCIGLIADISAAFGQVPAGQLPKPDKDFSLDNIADFGGFDLLLPSVHHPVHHLDLRFGHGLYLRTRGINNLLRPTKGPRSRSHLLDDLLKVFLAVLDGLRVPRPSKAVSRDPYG
jgi:hypothetical protein